MIYRQNPMKHSQSFCSALRVVHLDLRYIATDYLLSTKRCLLVACRISEGIRIHIRLACCFIDDLYRAWHAGSIAEIALMPKKKPDAFESRIKVRLVNHGGVLRAINDRWILAILSFHGQNYTMLQIINAWDFLIGKKKSNRKWQ